MNRYDAVRYPTYAKPETHPGRLAAMARLFGLESASPERSRVLELGCGTGGNLIPMAYGLPQGRFTGVDAAEGPVADGCRRIRDLGLDNISLRAMDLMDVGPEFGKFDYIVVHGVYSWVPAPVRDKILAICRANLAPNGVAYVSYNAYPGWHLKNAFRQMMLWHVRGNESPAERIQQARELLRFLAEAAPPRPVYSAILKEALEHQERQNDGVLFHDDLGEINEPFLFIDFMERAKPHGLKFLAEADFPDMAVWDPDSPSGRLLTGMAEDILLQQQYRDFLVLRRFRQTLLCRTEAPTVLEPDAETLRRLFVAASTRPQPAEASITSEEPVRFATDQGRELTTPHPLSKAAFLVLGQEWPRWIPVGELLARSHACLAEAHGAPSQDDDEKRLLGFLLRAYGTDILHLRSRPCPFVTSPSERPRASALARLQGVKGHGVTNLKHETVRLDDALVHRLLSLLDGTRDRAAIEDEMARFIREKGEPGADELLAALPERIAKNLDRVAKLALLEA